MLIIMCLLLVLVSAHVVIYKKDRSANIKHVLLASCFGVCLLMWLCCWTCMSYVCVRVQVCSTYWIIEKLGESEAVWWVCSGWI